MKHLCHNHGWKHIKFNIWITERVLQCRFGIWIQALKEGSCDNENLLTSGCIFLVSKQSTSCVVLSKILKGPTRRRNKPCNIHLDKTCTVHSCVHTHMHGLTCERVIGPASYRPSLVPPPSISACCCCCNCLKSKQMVLKCLPKIA